MANSTHQNTTQKTKDLETRISQQNRGKGWAVPAPLLAPIVLLWTKSCIKSCRNNCGILTVIKGIDQWLSLRKVERYQRGNQKPRIEGQKIQWPKKDIYKILHKKLLIEQHEPHLIHSELGCYERGSSSYSTSAFRHVIDIKYQPWKKRKSSEVMT